MGRATNTGSTNLGLLPAAADTAASDWRRLGLYLNSREMSFDPAQPIRQFASGLANRNYLVVVNGHRAVLRRPPDGDLPPDAHDMAREHKILSRLSNALAFVPRCLHYCEGRDVIGVPFQLIEYRPGIVIRGADLSPAGPRQDAPPLLCKMLVSTLASLHSVDAQSIGLDDLGKPQGFIGRAIAGWSKRGALVADSVSTQKLLNDISDWLKRQRFRERPSAILHCDLPEGRAIWPGEPAANVGKPRVETLGRTLVEHRKCAEHAGLTGFHDQIRSRDEKHRRRHHRDLEMSTQSIRQHVGCR